MSRTNEGARLLTIRAKYLGESSSGLAFKASLYGEEELEDSTIITTIWCAHSVITDGAGNRVVADYGNEITILVPLWLAEKGQFDSHYKQQLLDEEYGNDEDEEVPEDFDVR